MDVLKPDKNIRLGGILPTGCITDQDVAEVKRWFRETFLARIEYFNDDRAWDRRLEGIEAPRLERCTDHEIQKQDGTDRDRA